MLDTTSCWWTTTGTPPPQRRDLFLDLAEDKCRLTSSDSANVTVGHKVTRASAEPSPYGQVRIPGCHPAPGVLEMGGSRKAEWRRRALLAGSRA